jgi:hypothetical protein
MTKQHHRCDFGQYLWNYGIARLESLVSESNGISEIITFVNAISATITIVNGISETIIILSIKQCLPLFVFDISNEDNVARNYIPLLYSFVSQQDGNGTGSAAGNKGLYGTMFLAA